ncbi:hypothetical protein ZIOFF_002626 [Zingiber officinale]|uniref:Uncharacterized protein n=1 Tax=Zingiber officinale TaxID=94328 RepID=A0A8J5HX62_ZINOF|nr:hypothetical protein ZIOFF_002626 [Zingiber officinale]
MSVIPPNGGRCRPKQGLLQSSFPQFTTPVEGTATAQPIFVHPGDVLASKGYYRNSPTARLPAPRQQFDVSKLLFRSWMQESSSAIQHELKMNEYIEHLGSLGFAMDYELKLINMLKVVVSYVKKEHMVVIYVNKVSTPLSRNNSDLHLHETNEVPASTPELRPPAAVYSPTQKSTTVSSLAFSLPLHPSPSGTVGDHG